MGRRRTTKPVKDVKEGQDSKGAKRKADEEPAPPPPPPQPGKVRLETEAGEKDPPVLEHGDSMFTARSSQPVYQLKLTHYGKEEVKGCIAAISKGGRYDKQLVLTKAESEAYEKTVRQQEANLGQESPRAPGWDPLKQIGATMPRPHEDNLKPFWKGYPYDPAYRCGFEDRYEYERMILYLQHNGSRSMTSVPRNANTLLAAIRRQLGVKCLEFPDDPFFPNRYLRRMMVIAMIKHRRRLLDRYETFLKVTYGAGDETMPGPFSFRTYLEAALDRDFYCDEVMLCAFLWETKTTCTIVMNPSLVLYSVTDLYSLQDVDLVMTYNGYDAFSACSKYTISVEDGDRHGSKVVLDLDEKTTWISDTRRDSLWDSEEDGASTEEEEMIAGPRDKVPIPPRPGGDAVPPPPPPPALGAPPAPQPGTSKGGPSTAGGQPDSTPAPAPGPAPTDNQVVVDKDVLRDLLQTAQKAQGLAQSVAQAVGVDIGPPASDPPILPSLDRGQTVCTICGHKCSTPTNLKRHMAQHGAVPNFTCPKCGRGLSVRRTFENHVPRCRPQICPEMVEDPDGEVNEKGEKAQKECGYVAKTPQGLIRHRRCHKIREDRKKPDYTPTPKTHHCPFQCGKSYESANSLKVDHIPYCDKNPKKRPRKFCSHPGCKFGPNRGYKGFRKPKDLNLHWKKHGYKRPPPPDDNDK